jgi:hypothetical protein
MITPDEIMARAKRKYISVLQTWLLGDDFVPLEFPVGALSKEVSQRRKEIESLRECSKERRETGYDIEWETVNMQTLGKQTVPRRVIIPNLEDYLLFIRKTTEFNQFVGDVKKIRAKFPQLETWLQSYPQHVIEQHGHWDDLLAVCDYFVKHPRPNMYIRELPISVHTKFIETHTAILRELLDQLLPPDRINHQEPHFNKRFGLKDKPVLVRLHLLDEQLDWLYQVRMDDMTLPVSQVNDLLINHIKPKHVIIVENLINFLVLPKLPNTIGLWGGGFAIHNLADVTYLHQAHIVYWGDMDAQGFEILSDLRGIFSHSQSIMMDNDIFETYHQYIVEGKPSRSERFANLTALEASICQKIVAGNLRLEQEHIAHQEAVILLRKAILNDL